LSTALIEAVDALLAFVEPYDPARGNQNEEFDLLQFQTLDLTVYVEAQSLDLANELPKREEGLLAFLGKTNLPGMGLDSGAFVPMITSQWRMDMCALSVLAKSRSARAAKQRTGRPRKNETDKDTLVVSALAKHHQYEPGGSVGNFEPATCRKLAEHNNGISAAALSRFLARKFGGKGHQRYAAACHRGEIGRLLANWQGDVSEGHRGLLPHEDGRKEEN